MDKSRKPEDPLWSIGQAAQYSGISAAHLRALVTAGVIPAIDVSSPGTRRKRFRLRHDDVDAFLASRRIPSREQSM